MAQNEMMAKPALPERVRSMEGLCVLANENMILVFLASRLKVCGADFCVLSLGVELDRGIVRSVHRDPQARAGALRYQVFDFAEQG